MERRNHPAFKNARDLKSDLRPQLDVLTSKLFEAFANVQWEAKENGEEVALGIHREAVRILNGSGIDEVIRETAIARFLAKRSLEIICPFSNCPSLCKPGRAASITRRCNFFFNAIS